MSAPSDRPPAPVPTERSLPRLRAAGGVLDRGLEEAGIARQDVYITNAVKHFRYKLRGRRRIHQKPDRWQVSACLPAEPR